MGRLARRSASALCRAGLLLLVVNCAFQVAFGQKPVIVQYNGNDQSGLWLEVPGDKNANIKEVTNEDMTCRGDFGWSKRGLELSTLGSVTGDVSGSCVYNVRVPLIQPCSNPSVVTSFSATFQVMVTDPPGSKGTPEGVAFIVGSEQTEGGGGGYLGWLNSSTNAQGSPPAHNFAVEVDSFQNVEFQDPAYTHVGVDKNNLTSIHTSPQLWIGSDLLNSVDSMSTCLWVEYHGSTQILEVFISSTLYQGDNLGSSFLFDKSTTPIISEKVDLSDIMTPGGMFIGFSGSISNNRTTAAGNNTSFTILQWTFNSDGFAPDLPRLADGRYPSPSDMVRKRERKRILRYLAIAIPSAALLVFLVVIICVLYKRNARLSALARKYEIEAEALNRGCQVFKYKALSTATKAFSAERLLGSGGFGSVYRGEVVLKGDEKPTKVAVKRIAATSQQGAEEFKAEVRIIGQAQHRNLVRLLGWCHERAELLLVYDYMPNGSVDQHLFSSSSSSAPGELVLTWPRRLKIVSGVATALAYLHEEWEQRVIHRDVKSSNILLDANFNGRLGDFGLARLSQHDQAPASTAVLAGTYGYMAPELGHTLKPTEKTDVYSFGALVLEMATGKRALLPREDREAFDEFLLVNWVWGLYGVDALLDAADDQLNNAYEPGEMVMFLKIGLLCSHPNPDERPSMREVLNIWKGSAFPSLPRTRPVPVFPASVYSDLDLDVDVEPAVLLTDVDRSNSNVSAGHNSLIKSWELDAHPARTTPSSSVRHRSRTITSLPF